MRPVSLRQTLRVGPSTNAHERPFDKLRVSQAAERFSLKKLQGKILLVEI
jgi:hypothetical protein